MSKRAHGFAAVSSLDFDNIQFPGSGGVFKQNVLKANRTRGGIGMGK